MASIYSIRTLGQFEEEELLGSLELCRVRLGLWGEWLGEAGRELKDGLSGSREGLALQIVQRSAIFSPQEQQLGLAFCL